MSVLMIIAGFILLVLGGHWLVMGAVGVAKKLDLPTLVIGIVLVGFGTSVPELVTSIEATLIGSPGIAVGNVVGSNIANILLVAAIGVLIVPVTVIPHGFRRDAIVLTLATVVFALSAFSGEISRVVGLFYVALLVIYLAYTIKSERRKSRVKPEDLGLEDDLVAELKTKHPLYQSLGKAVFGIAITIIGAKILVKGAVDIAIALGVSETIIGLTIVAIGTSLPELSAAVIAGLKKHSDVSIGNIIGSNIFNILSILGVTAMVKPLEIDPAILRVDLWVMAGATAVMILAPLVLKGIARPLAAIMLLGYCAYITYLYIGA